MVCLDGRRDCMALVLLPSKGEVRLEEKEEANDVCCAV